MHVVTVKFAIVLDGEVPLESELENLVKAIGLLYGAPGPCPDPTFYTPNGEWQIVEVGPEVEAHDLTIPSPVPGWPRGIINHE